MKPRRFPESRWAQLSALGRLRDDAARCSGVQIALTHAPSALAKAGGRSELALVDATQSQLTRNTKCCSRSPALFQLELLVRLSPEERHAVHVVLDRRRLKRLSPLGSCLVLRQTNSTPSRCDGLVFAPNQTPSRWLSHWQHSRAALINPQTPCPAIDTDGQVGNGMSRNAPIDPAVT